MAINVRPVVPYVTIQKNDLTLYTHDPFTPSRNFQIKNLSFDTPSDNNAGKFDMTIYGATGATSELATIDGNIDEGNEVTIWIGKTDALKSKRFLGVIESIEITDVNPNYSEMHITGIDWGSDVLPWRVIFGSRIQRKLDSNQNKLDDTDDSVLAKNIVISMLRDYEWYPDETNRITVEEQGVVVNPDNIDISPVRISQIEANYEYIDDKLNEIAGYTESTYFVDPDKNFIMKQKDTINDSGILFIDDETDGDATGHDQTKLGYILSGANHKRTVENHRRRLFGLGANLTDIDQQQNTHTAKSSMTSTWVAQQFTPKFGDFYNLALYLGGNPTVDGSIFIQEDNGGLPTGKVLRSFHINNAVAQGGGKWVYFPVGEKLVVNQPYWIILAETAGLNWYHDNTDSGSSTHATSPDGITWTLSAANRYGMTYLHFVSAPLTVIVPTNVAVGDKHFHEEVIHRPDINEEKSMNRFINGTYASVSKRKKMLNLNVRCPDIIPNNRDNVTIKKSNTADPIASVKYTITKIEYIFETGDDTSTGTYNFNMELNRMEDYA